MDRETFARHAGRTLWLCAWGDFEAEEGREHGGVDLDNVAPPTPEIAVEAARQLYDSMSETVAADFAAWHGACGFRAFYQYTPEDRYAHCCAMEALVHGVSRQDDPRDDYTPNPQDLYAGPFDLYRGNDGNVYLGARIGNSYQHVKVEV